MSVASVVALFVLRPDVPRGPKATVVGTLPASARPAPSASPIRPPLPNLDDPRIWAGWAVFDGQNGLTSQGGQPGGSTTESMIKVAIGAEYLRQLQVDDRVPDDDERDKLSRMIRVSDNDAAESLYRAGGGDQMLKNVIAICGLRQTRTKPGWWSETTMTPADAAHMAACIADGAVCSPPWAEWLLNEMRQVTGNSRFGAVDVRPTDRGVPLAMKNGYTLRDYDHLWHVNCLAVAHWWTMAIMVRYPGDLGLVYGKDLCREIAAAIMPADEGAPAPPPATGAPAAALTG